MGCSRITSPASPVSLSLKCSFSFSQPEYAPLPLRSFCPIYRSVIANTLSVCSGAFCMGNDGLFAHRLFSLPHLESFFVCVCVCCCLCVCACLLTAEWLWWRWRMLTLSESSSLPSLKPEQSCLFLPHFYQSFITGGLGCWWLKPHFCRAAFEYGYIIHTHVYPQHTANKQAQVSVDRSTNAHKAAMGAEEEVNLQEAERICRQNTHAGLNTENGFFHIHPRLCNKDLIHIKEFGLKKGILVFSWWFDELKWRRCWT